MTNSADIKKARKEANKEYIRAYKDRPCADCGGVFPVCCMDLHHVEQEGRDSKTKRNGNSLVSQLCHFSRERIDAELSKCVVLCANCHRIRHWG